MYTVGMRTFVGRCVWPTATYTQQCANVDDGQVPGAQYTARRLVHVRMRHTFIRTTCATNYGFNHVSCVCRTRHTQYTKQGILCMLRTGIIVEPTLMREWHTMVGNVGDYGMSSDDAHAHTCTQR
jgi:hypothetical protein